MTSEESGADKPDAAVFKAVIEKLSPELEPVWMIGDNYLGDLIGAKNAICASTLGLRSELREHAADPQVDGVFDSFGDLERYVLDRGWE